MADYKSERFEMSKKICRENFTAFCALSLSAALLLTNILTVGRAQSAKPAATVNPKASAIREATAEVLRETGELRQLAVLRPVESGAQSRAEIEQMLIKSLDESSTPEEMRASQVVLIKLGLVPPDFRFRPFIISLLTEQVAGYYEPKTQHFYLADWIDLEGQKPVMAHELTHALQDQHFNLRRFEKWPKGDSDAELAAHALIEGDATVAMTHYILRNPARALAMMKSMSGGTASTVEIDKAPRALRESLLFPYDRGMAWVNQVYRRGGWALVSQAYKDLPKSTEQVLHAEKYFAGEQPVKVELPDIKALLGKNWKRTDTDVNGEWGYYLVLDQFLKERGDSQRAAEGWGGDRYALYEGANKGEALLAQLSVWDTDDDAIEFFDAYVKRTALRYQAEQSPNNVTLLGNSASYSLPTSEGAVLVERHGARVAILEGVPQNVKADNLMKKLWQPVAPREQTHR